MTPNQITTLLAKPFGKELDVPFKKMLYEQVKYWRATIIKQSVDKTPIDKKFFRQTIYLPMEKVAIGPLTCYAARTTIDVPLPLRVSDAVFDYVGGPDLKSPFGWADAGTIGYLLAGKYSGKFTYTEYVNQRIYTSQMPDLKSIAISGIFNNPEEAAVYQTEPPNYNIDWWNQDIPISGDIEQRVIQCIKNTDYAKTPESKDKAEDWQVQVNDEQI